ncbi:ABC transporter substrate-binding protein [Burkholderia cepacia]|uniref:ABC transporter substrate-binding protein n=1 Tax=Burkholderia cepacia TaxID=292 RepID=UPI001F1951C6|nr:ABC transporter substrate-binding protein [Burkholderia cepacia]MCE4124406.1 ABC transporter substrate-binding protein [Burkholderia cepacia]
MKLARRVVLILLISLGLPQFALAAANDSKIVIAIPNEPPGLDPAMQAPASVSEVTWQNVFEGLTKFDPHGRIVPSLAVSWTRPDPNTYIFKLRPGVKFHDGTPFSSEDVKFSFERAAGPDSTSKRKRVFVNFAKIDTPDPLTVKITTKEPSALLPFFLAEGTAAIESSKSASNNRSHPIGTGPYKFVSWTRGDSVTLVRYPDYKGPVTPTIQNVVFRFISDENAQVLALKGGQVDYLPYMAAADTVKTLKSDSRFRVSAGTTQGVLFLGFNNKKKPFNDVRVRRALYYALDPDAINDGAYGGFAKKPGAQVTTLNPYFVDVLSGVKYDPEKAKKLLSEAGYPNGFAASFKVMGNPTYRRAAEIVVAQLSEVGIQTKLEIQEIPTWMDVVFKHKNYDMTLIEHREPWAIFNFTDPNYFYQYDNEKFRATMKAVEASKDEDEIRRNMAAAQRQLLEDAPVVFLDSVPIVGVVNKALTGTRVDYPLPSYPVAEMSWSK